MAKIDDQRLYVIRERAYFESPRGQAVFKCSKNELDDAEKDPNGIIREEASRVLCLLRNPKAYMETILEERSAKGEPLYPMEDVQVSAPKRDEGRVVVGGETEIRVRDMQNGGMIAPLRADDIVTRGGGMMNFLVVVREGKFYATATGIQDEEITPEIVRKRAYRRIGTKSENPELIDL